jgi:cytochrome c oxidase assembly protein Cox11
MCDVLSFFWKFVANRKLVALVMGKYLLLVVFFSAEGPQDKDTIGKVILNLVWRFLFFSVEGPQGEDLV